MRSTLLEANFPYVAVSQLVAADRRSPDPAYQAHRWWARRPPALVRAGLLAASLPADTTLDEFWSKFADPGSHLDGVTVLDPFMGGGTTLVEASRLGATAHGQDVDPMAVEINRHQADPPSAEQVREAGQRLLEALGSSLGQLWPAFTDEHTWSPLHYFSVARVSCPNCDHQELAYRSPVLARSIGKPGAVVRQEAVTVFCPACLGLHHLGADAKAFSCCDRQWALDTGTFRGGRYHCPQCASRSSHDQLQTGSAPRVLVAVEETRVGGHRRLRPPRPSDQPEVERIEREHLDRKLEVPETDRRPVSYGVTTMRGLHTPRQIAYLVGALDWIAANVEDSGVARALRLAVSTSIISNNRLCGYATDYGRLSPLFSVRAFSMPVLSVELNPLHPTGGRGSLLAAIARVVQSCVGTSRRNVIERGALTRIEQVYDSSGDVSVSWADSSRGVAGGVDVAVCFTDPPYYDYIPYDTLSQVFRAWLPKDGGLAGSPVLPSGEDPVSQFADLLGSALRNVAGSLAETGLVAFTFKGSSEAWDGVSRALRAARLRVTALWPVLADPGMGHHSGQGNCEFDLLVVARGGDDNAALPKPDPDDWIAQLSLTRSVTTCDQNSFRTAIEALHDHWYSGVSQLSIQGAERNGCPVRATQLCEGLQHRTAI